MSKQDNLTEFLTGVADAIREKKESEELINPQDFEDEIRSIETGIDTSDGTATNDDILYGRVAYAKDKQLRGTILTYPSSTKFIFAAAPGNGNITMNVAGVYDMGGYWDYFDAFSYSMGGFDDYFYMKVYKNNDDGTRTVKNIYTTKTKQWVNENNRTIIFFTDRVTAITGWDKSNYDGPYSLGPAVLAKSVEGATQPTAKKYFAEDVTVYPVLEEKEIIPTKEIQNVAVSDGYAGLAKVSVAAIPDEFMETSDATATVDDIRFDKTAYVASGKVTGTIEDYDGSSEPASGKSLFAQLVDRSITEVNASDLAGISKIGNYAFYNCSNLTNITIPNSVTSIGYCAFNNCSNLMSIMVPDSVTSIGIGAFQRCSSLTDIMIPDSVTSIGGNAFYECTKITSITIPNGIERIDSYTFYGCTKLTNIIIPDSITIIGAMCFYECTKLTGITIGNGVTRIDGGIFYSCGTKTESGTTYTFLPTTPPTIQSNTFASAKINKIIVPIGTADIYKAATNWSTLADYIEEAEA